jgi:hypothetical protein
VNSRRTGQLRVAGGRRFRHRVNRYASPHRRNHDDERPLHHRLPHGFARQPDFERDGIQLDVHRDVLGLVVRAATTPRHFADDCVRRIPHREPRPSRAVTYNGHALHPNDGVERRNPHLRSEPR